LGEELRGTVDNRLRVARVTYDPGTLNSKHVSTREDRKRTRSGPESDRLYGYASRKCQRRLRRGVECGRIAGVDGCGRGRRPIGARVPVTGAWLRQPNGIYGEHRGRCRQKQRQRRKAHADGSDHNAWKFLGASGGGLDMLKK